MRRRTMMHISIEEGGVEDRIEFLSGPLTIPDGYYIDLGLTEEEVTAFVTKAAYGDLNFQWIADTEKKLLHYLYIDDYFNCYAANSNINPLKFNFGRDSINGSRPTYERTAFLEKYGSDVSIYINSNTKGTFTPRDKASISGPAAIGAGHSGLSYRYTGGFDVYELVLYLEGEERLWLVPAVLDGQQGMYDRVRKEFHPLILGE